VIPAALSHIPWYYLSGFYYRDPCPGPRKGAATKILKAAIARLDQPGILCCEPILGSDPRSLTAKNEHLTADERYEELCSYYRTVFGLNYELQIDCTLKTELSGKGKRWNYAERKFMLGLQQSPPSMSAIEDVSRVLFAPHQARNSYPVFEAAPRFERRSVLQ